MTLNSASTFAAQTPLTSVNGGAGGGPACTEKTHPWPTAGLSGGTVFVACRPEPTRLIPSVLISRLSLKVPGPTLIVSPGSALSIAACIDSPDETLMTSAAALPDKSIVRNPASAAATRVILTLILRLLFASGPLPPPPYPQPSAE